MLRAQLKGYAVLVLNPNCQSEEPGSRSKEEHCLTAWDRLVDSPRRALVDASIVADLDSQTHVGQTGARPSDRGCGDDW